MKNVEGMILGLKDHCIYAAISDEAALLDAEKKQYHAMNGPASFILSALAGEHGISFAELKAKVMAKYEVNEATALSEVNDFLDNLSRLNFLKVESKIAMVSPKIEITGEVLSTIATKEGKPTPTPKRHTHTMGMTWPRVELTGEVLSTIATKEGKPTPTPKRHAPTMGMMRPRVELTGEVLSTIATKEGKPTPTPKRHTHTMA